MRCILKKGKDKPVRGRHPWIFSGAIDQIEEGVKPGDLLKVYSAEGGYLGTGYVNPNSQIAVRMLTFEDVPVDAAFFRERIEWAIRLRKETGLPSAQTNAFRLIHAEGDFLPGLVVDRYADYLAVQILTEGIERRKNEIAGILEDLLCPEAIFEKSDSEFREMEGLAPRTGVLVKAKSSDSLPPQVEILENGHRFWVDLEKGQKTGFFLDQRENRSLVKRYAGSRSFLNCFAYTGAFSVYAAAGGARSVLSVDSSQAALDLAAKQFALNGLSGNFGFIRDDVFRYLRQSNHTFDFIVLDPPAFCKSKQQVSQACRGYKDINLYALKRLSPHGLLFTASCSSYISADLFQKVLFAAAKDAGRNLRVIAKNSHAPDHPLNIYHPEGEYLKGFLCEVI